MPLKLRFAGAAAGFVLTMFLALAATAVASPGHSGQYHKAVCPGPAAPGATRCHAQVVTDASGKPLAGTSPSNGYQPLDLQAAYNLGSAASTLGAGSTIAIVDAYDDPNARADLDYYRANVNGSLPPLDTNAGCTLTQTSAPCFKKVGQSGSTTSLPSANASWAQEISLDLDMASAICPKCNILLVEANSSYMTDLGAAENTAASLGATVISNSYGGNEFSTERSYDTYYDHPGIPITVSSGDSGYGAEYPATSPNVTAVGGTHLVQSNGVWSESAWSGAGSGCSAVEPRPTWQPAVDSNCSRRAEADVSADADPNTGVAVYDSYAYNGQSGWLVFGGTSVAAPIVAGVYALANNHPALGYPYAHNSPSTLSDVISGRNGRCRKDPRMCNAGTGWDGPTGLGTPNGIGAF